MIMNIVADVAILLIDDRFVLSMCTGTSKFHFQVREERVDGKVFYTFDTDKEQGPKLPTIQVTER